jgi:hypothetical protein
VAIEFLAVLGAGAIAALVSFGGALRRRRELKRFEDLCVDCGRKILAGIRTCDCDFL